MDTDTLERLLIDRALDDLPADTEALLAAYLEHEEQATTEAKALDQTVSLARKVLSGAAPSATGLPPFPGARLARAHRMRRFRLAAALAACALIGFGLGALGLQPPPPAPPERAQPVATATTRPPAETTGSTDRSAFWSVQAWRQRATLDRPSPSRQLIWDSVVKWPRIGDS